MTTRPELERTVAAWLDAAAGEWTPDYFDEIEDRVARTSQRAWWSSPERWLPVDLTTRANAFTSPRIGRPLLIGLLVVALLATVVLVAAGTRRTPPPPFGLARCGSVITSRGGDIVRADSEQAIAKPIIAGPTDDFAPVPSRDGTKLAFLRAITQHSAQLMLANIDGSDIKPILDEPVTDTNGFEWSAGDDRLAIISTIDGLRALSIVDIGHRTSTRIDVGDLPVVEDVHWLPPSGESLIFKAGPHPAEGIFAIYTVRGDGTDLRRISDVGGDQTTYADLNVSADGRTISYWNDESSTDTYDANGTIVARSDGSTPGPRIHLRDLATNEDRPITFGPAGSGDVLATPRGEKNLVFSPDSRHAVVRREDEVSAQLLIASLDGSSPNFLIGPKFDWNSTPVYGFSPDGAHVFVSFPNEKPTFYDVHSGAATTGPEAIESWGGYQRTGQ